MAWFAPQYPHVSWQPSDINTHALAVINAYNQENTNVHPAVVLDTQAPDWRLSAAADLICCINMTHISPFESTLGLFKHAQNHIAQAGLLYLYGPFNRDQKFTSEGNAAFHASLQAQNPSWGLRDIEEIIHVAELEGWRLLQRMDMPANNMSVLFQTNQ